MKTNPVRDYIRANWERSIYRDANGSGFRGEDLPFAYTSPCIRGEGKFYFFFYWDTYFTNLGLLRDGLMETAADNIRNMLWLIRRQGYMPNHVGITNRSQPPYLCRMVEEYFAALGGPEREPDFFRECAEGLRQEYFFWTLGRHTPTGLQRHGHHDTEAGCAVFYDGPVASRLGLSKDVPEAEKAIVGGHHMAEAETGWDFNPRFAGRCLDHNPADLNGLLFSYETFLTDASERLGWGDEALWRRRSAERKERVDAFHWCEKAGWFFDYDFVQGRQSEVLALSGLLPLFTGLASAGQAARVVARLPELELERGHGVAVTHERPGCRNYQWAFPNAWPPLTYVAVEGLRRYGFEADAERIARKFLSTTDRLFAATGQLWEKTDVETGEVAGGEYDAAPMIGWTAGVYIALDEWLGR